MGVITLYFEGDKFLVLDDCLYVPGVRRNLVSVSCLSCNGYSSFFNKDSIFVKYNDNIICRGMLQDNIYLLNQYHCKLTHMKVIIRERRFHQ